MKEYTVNCTVDITQTYKLDEKIPAEKENFKTVIECILALYNFDNCKIKNLKVFEKVD